MPLPRVYRVVQDSLGNTVPQVLCSVLLQGTGTLATLWQNDAGTIPLSNPMTSDATYGSFGFYVEPGHYDLTFTKPGYTFQPHLDMQVPQDALTLGTMAQQDAHAVAITGGTANLAYVATTGPAPSVFNAPVGIKGAPTFDLDIFGNTRMSLGLGIGVSPQAGVHLMTGTLPSIFAGRLGLKGAPTFDLDVFGETRMSLGLGIGVSPQPNVHLVTGTLPSLFGGPVGIKGAPTYDLDVFGTTRLGNLARINNALGINTDPAFPLDVSGVARIMSELGLGAPPVVGFHLRTGALPSVFSGRLGLKGDPSYDLDIFGETRMSLGLGIGVSPLANFHLRTGTADSMFGGRLGIQGNPAYDLDVVGMAHVSAQVGIQAIAHSGIALNMGFSKSSQTGIAIKALENDAATTASIGFYNVANTPIGSITTTASATAFNTSSDPRLKTDVQDLVDALATLQRLRPVAFRWKADGSVGHSFLATDVQQVVPEAVSGEAGAVDGEGNILPQQLDMSKLIPWIVGAVQALAERVTALEAR